MFQQYHTRIFTGSLGVNRSGAPSPSTIQGKSSYQGACQRAKSSSCDNRTLKQTNRTLLSRRPLVPCVTLWSSGPGSSLWTLQTLWTLWSNDSFRKGNDRHELASCNLLVLAICHCESDRVVAFCQERVWRRIPRSTASIPEIPVVCV